MKSAQAHSFTLYQLSVPRYPRMVGDAFLKQPILGDLYSPSTWEQLSSGLSYQVAGSLTVVLELVRALVLKTLASRGSPPGITRSDKVVR